jgi:hypothetical protein
MKTLVMNALVVALCDAEVAVLLRLLDHALDARWLDGGEAYVATELRRELRRELPVLEAGAQWCCPTSFRCRWTQQHVNTERR